METLWDALRASADRRSEAEALRCGDDVITFGDWVDRAEVMSRHLAHEVEAEEFVGIAVSHATWIPFAVTYIAVQLAGAVPVPIRADASERDWELMCREAKLGLVVDVCRDPQPRSGPPLLPVDRLKERGSGGPARRISKTADAVFTSGTMGTPKAVASTHAELLSGGRLPPAWRGRNLVHTMPPYSAGGVHGAMRLAIMSALCASSPSVLSVWHIGELKKLLEQPDSVAVYTTPHFANAVAREVGSVGSADLGHVRMVIVTGAASVGSTMADGASTFPSASLINAYGSTEAGMAQTFMVYDAARPAALGRSMGRTELAILDAGTGSPIREAGQQGEIALRRAGAPQRRYVTPNEEGAFAEAGWVKTGDLGYLDEDGYLFLVDRKKDIAIRGGENISMRQVESAILEHPAVTDVGVVAVPMDTGDDEVVAFVVGIAPVPELRALVREYLSSPSAFPGVVRYVDEIPKTALGKVDKNELRRRVAVEFEGR